MIRGVTRQAPTILARGRKKQGMTRFRHARCVSVRFPCSLLECDCPRIDIKYTLYAASIPRIIGLELHAVQYRMENEIEKQGTSLACIGLKLRCLLRPRRRVRMQRCLWLWGCRLVRQTYFDRRSSRVVRHRPNEGQPTARSRWCPPPPSRLPSSNRKIAA